MFLPNGVHIYFANPSLETSLEPSAIRYIVAPVKSA